MRRACELQICDAPMRRHGSTTLMELVMQHRSSHVHAITAALAVVAMIAVGCTDTSGAAGRTPGLARVGGPQSRWVGCESGRKYTGGGRVDPVDIGKVTFGFNVDGSDACDGTGAPKGNLEVVYHYNQTLYHAVTIEHFATYSDPEKGDCVEFDGTARSKHVDDGGDWHFHHYSAEMCDKAEPGHGADRFQFLPDGEPPQHENVWSIPLTGGNIQAHKS